jgi:hypothetical protein
METLLGLLMGVALAAACGMRVFIPVLVVAVGSRAGVIHLSPGFDWMASWPAIISFSSAAVLELTAAHWPWLDHALDVIASPCAVVAGTIIAASQMHDVSPAVSWTAGLIAGGGAAGATQAASVTTRGASTVTTAGLLNPVLNALQTMLAGVLSALAVIVPALAGLIVLALLVTILRWWWGRRSRRLAAREFAADGAHDSLTFPARAAA